jgi:hypothetical protein
MHNVKTSRQRVALGILTGTLLLLSALSMRAMAVNSLWFDEVWSLRYAGGAQYGPISLAETISRVSSQTAHEKNPPGYYLLLNAWGHVAGWSEFSGWMLTLLAGLVTVALMYRLGHDLAGGYGQPAATVVGLSAAVTLALSAFFIQYLYEMRAYMLVMLLTIAILWMYWRLIDTDRQPGVLLQSGYVLIVAISLYTHYTLIVVLAAVGLYHLLCVPKTRRWWRIVLLTAVGGLLFVPWSLTLLDITERAAEVSVPYSISPGEILRTYTAMFSNVNVGLLALLAVFSLKARGRPKRFAWVVAVACLSLGILVGILVPVLGSIRYLIFLWPTTALVVAFGVDQLRRRTVSPAWILAIWVAAGLATHFNASFAGLLHENRMPWKAFRAQLQEYAQPGDVVLYHAPVRVWSEGPELAYYLYGLPVRGGLTEDIPGKPLDDEYLNSARQYIGNAPRVWLGVDQGDPPNFRLADVQRVLAENYQRCFTAFDLRLMRLEFYARNLTNPQARFGNQSSGQIGVGLIGPLTPQVGKTLPVLLAFAHPPTTPPDTYSVAVHVEDAAGQLRAQADFGLSPSVNDCRLASVAIGNLPPGKYTVLVAIYEWRTGRRLAGQLVATGMSGDRLALGSFTIAP